MTTRAAERRGGGKRDLVVALDLDGAAARRLVRRLGTAVDFYKVPPALTLEDPRLVPWLLRRKKRVFLDCKWYDIPSQVKRSVEAAGRAGITACTIHAGAGSAVMRAALSAQPRPRVWGVTVLTSLGATDLAEVGVRVSPADQVLRLARLAERIGLDGLVCSAQEVPRLRRAGLRLPLVTPGIQFGDAVGADQKRVSSPQAAWAAGADILVVGRSIVEAGDPVGAARRVLDWKRRA